MSHSGSITSVLVPIHKEGHKFIAIFGGVALLLFLLSDTLGFLGMLATLWCIYFFRDPARTTPSREGLIISPADGLVQAISSVSPPAELEMGDNPLTRISIFMNVFDVHVNRSPVSATISKMHYYAGAFLNASLDKASEKNERQAFRLTLDNGQDIAVVQIAGLVARRIIAFKSVEDKVEAGERIGMIRFGSRVDVYLPKGVNPQVIEGQRALAGETVLADMNAAEPARQGKAA